MVLETSLLNTQHHKVVVTIERVVFDYVANFTFILYNIIPWRPLHKNAARNIEQFLEAATHKAAVRPPTAHHENYQN